MSSKTKSLYHKISAAAQLPRDLSAGAVLVTVTGQEEVCIENYRGIIEYTDSRLLLLTKNCRLEILGSRLFISYYTGEEMKVTGHIGQINYL